MFSTRKWKKLKSFGLGWGHPIVWPYMLQLWWTMLVRECLERLTILQGSGKPAIVNFGIVGYLLRVNFMGNDLFYFIFKIVLSLWKKWKVGRHVKRKEGSHQFVLLSSVHFPFFGQNIADITYECLKNIVM